MVRAVVNAMPNRIVRESLLDSPRYLSIDEGAQLLFCKLLLLADDFGCLPLSLLHIGRRCFANRPTDERLKQLLDDLVAADLLRRYEVNGSFYGHIPRFGQRLRSMTSKYPMPPPDILDIDPLAMPDVSEAQWQVLRKKVMERDGAACVICATTISLSIDHIWPKSKGGRSVVDNLATLCRSCNSVKARRTEFSHDLRELIQQMSAEREHSHANGRESPLARAPGIESKGREVNRNEGKGRGREGEPPAEISRSAVELATDLAARMKDQTRLKKA